LNILHNGLILNVGHLHNAFDGLLNILNLRNLNNALLGDDFGNVHNAFLSDDLALNECGLRSEMGGHQHGVSELLRG
jgi:hypothetical protein